MLRITRSESANGVLLRLEGRLTAGDLPLVARALAARKPREVAFDLSELRALDSPSRSWLAALIAAGARVSATTPFLARFLAART